MKLLLLLFMAGIVSVQMPAQNDSLDAGKGNESVLDSIIRTLPEIMLVKEKPIVRSEGGKLVFNMPGLLRGKPVTNAYDALKELPGVTTDGDDVKLGGTPVTIMLDGKATSMTREQLTGLLKSMPADRLKDAEMMYAAPAHYGVRGKLINIILNKETDRDAALQGELFGSVQTEHEAAFNERLSLVYKKGKFSVDAFCKMQHGKEYYTMYKTGIHTLADGNRYDITMNNVTHKDSQPKYDWRLGADMDFSQKHRLSLSYAGDYADGHAASDMTGLQCSRVTNENRHVMHNGNVEYKLPTGTKIGADITYYSSSFLQNLKSNMGGIQMDFISSNAQGINRSKVFIQQEHRFRYDWMLNYGTAYTYTVDHSSQNYDAVGNTVRESLPENLNSRRTEDTWNMYVGGNHSFGTKLSVEASLAAEHYHAIVWNEWELYPTVTVSFTPQSRRVWQFSVSSDKSYPEFWAMQEATSYYGGRYDEIVGNPLLHPSKSYDIGLMHVYEGKYFFRMWFSHVRRRFMQTMYQSPLRLAEIDQHNNSDFMQQVGMMASVPVKIGWWMDTRMNLFGVWMREKDSDYYDSPFDRNVAYGMAMLRSTFRFFRNRDLTLSLNGFIRSKAIQGSMDLPASGDVDIALCYAFARHKAVVNLYCNDVFQTRSISPICRWAGQNLRTEFSCYRVAGISVAYQFGGYKEKKRGEVDTSRMRK